MVFALHQLDKKKKKKKKKALILRNCLFSFATFTVNLTIKEQNKTELDIDLLEGKKIERNRKRFKDFLFIINNTNIILYDTENNITKCYL